MGYITDATKLKSFIFGKLGGRKHRINITDDDWDDIVGENLKYLKDYSSDVVYDEFIQVNVNNKELRLPENVVNVKFVKEPRVETTFSSTLLLGASPVYDYIMTGDSFVSDVYVFRDNMKQIRQVMNKHVKFNYNTESKILRLSKDCTNVWIGVTKAEDIDELYNNHFFHLLLERDCWQRWVDNNSKFAGATVGNGIELNVEHYEKRYQELKDEIKESQSEEEFDLLRPVKLSKE